MIVDDPAIIGPHRPQSSVPVRAPSSIRRTSTIDTFRPDGFDGEAVVAAHARDLVTDASGAIAAQSRAHIDARLEARVHTLLAIDTAPGEPGAQALVGTMVGPGFRAKVDLALPHLTDSGALLYLLLDDLPGATLVAGYSMLHAGAIPPASNDEYLVARSDLCAGWAGDGVMMTMIREHGQSPATQGPDAPVLLSGSDPDAWHDVPALDRYAMRRLRRIDVGASTLAPDPDPLTVDAFFRDSHVDGEGRETIVHEYSVRATVDPETRVVLDIDAAADVLPWRECPGALGSAQRLVGMPLAGLRPWVRATFTGTTTCTHLNDVLRGLADVGPMLSILDGALSAAGRRGG